MQTLIVDGYNVVHAWPALKRILQTRGLEDARDQLVHALSEYSAHSGVQVTVVFDSHERTETAEPPAVLDGVTVRFGTKAASADHVIERLAQRRARHGEAGQVTVATGDRLQRALVGAMGVATISAEALAEEVARASTDAVAARHRNEGPSRIRRVEEQLSPE
ncbi:MAG: NYN domain-containing protein, partial [Candidatus Dormibacteraeota bacterium]|nr:NYN domain-containing protein [Candidatus Dormibacteraeota bacterium]